jgi:predicted regulator of Ras-like GTPase activity (Roadblock/LC7/MglB family)
MSGAAIPYSGSGGNDPQGGQMGLHDERIGENRWLMLSEGDARTIDGILEEFLALSGAKCALLVDKDGYLVTQRGDAYSFTDDTISALLAGGYAATKEIARLLGEDEFCLLYHQGKRENIQLTLVANRVLLTVIFDEQTTLGMVRLYSQEAAKKIAAAIQRMEESPSTAPEGDFGADFTSTAQEKLDDLFR